ncbi:MAG TPA: hypothetical protein VF147_14780 [Vicinamibacterales bacterium]
METQSDRFYVRMAVAFLCTALIGFAPTYWIPLLRGTLHIAPITHLHALFFYGWLTLFAWQSALAASGRLKHHRRWGMAGIAVATGMCFVGLGMTINALKDGLAAGITAARPFSIVSSTAIALFAVLFGLAIRFGRDREVHQRLMLVATASLLQAAVGRVFLFFLAPPRPPGLVSAVAPPPVAVTVLPGILVDLFIVAGMIHDRRTRGRVHKVYWIAGAAVLAVQVLRVPVSSTAVWAHVTNWLLAVAP